MKIFGRILLAFSAILFAFGAYIHTSAFDRMSDAVAKSVALVAIRPAAATRFVVVILGLLPVSTAVLIYHFIGNFVGGHIFLAGGLAAVLGGLMLPGSRQN